MYVCKARTRLQVVSLFLSPSSKTVNKPQGNNGRVKSLGREASFARFSPQRFCVTISFLVVFFRVTDNGPRERGTSRSLSACRIVWPRAKYRTDLLSRFSVSSNLLSFSFYRLKSVQSRPSRPIRFRMRFDTVTLSLNMCWTHRNVGQPNFCKIRFLLL